MIEMLYCCKCGETHGFGYDGIGQRVHRPTCVADRQVTHYVKLLLAESKQVRELRAALAAADARAERLKAALEGMVEQYMRRVGDEYWHDYMSAGEDATDALADEPEWEDTGMGLRHKPDAGLGAGEGEHQCD